MSSSLISAIFDKRPMLVNEQTQTLLFLYQHKLIIHQTNSYLINSDYIINIIMKQSTNEQKYVDKNQTPNLKEEQRPYLWYVISWLLFLAALGIFGTVYAINSYAFSHKITSNYYRQEYAVSSTATSATVAANSLAIYTEDYLKQLQTVAMSLLYSWMLFKIPLLIFTYSLIEDQQNLKIRIPTIAGAAVLLLAGDILLFIFMLNIYNDGMYYLANWLLTIIVVVINRFNLNQTKQAILDSVIPLLIIAFFYCCQCFFIPALFNTQLKNLSTVQGTIVWIYTYPALDLILYSLLLLANHYSSQKARKFLSIVQFQLIGYGAGIILLIGYTQVEFYYLISYFIFRNVFVNWVVWKWEGVVNNPACLPGWGLCYYLGFLLNFVPVVGVGKLVVSYAFKTAQFTLTSSMYFPINYDYPYTTYAQTSLNSGFIGNIFWLAGLIIWIGMTFSQKYPCRKPEWKDFFFYIFGIYLFYQAITAALQLNVLKSNTI